MMLSCAISPGLRFVSPRLNLGLGSYTSPRLTFHSQVLSTNNSLDKMANNALIPFLVTMMLVTGVCNTILNKYQVSSQTTRMDKPNHRDQS